MLDMKDNEKIPLIMERPFLAMGKILIDLHQGKLILRVGDDQVTFNVLKGMNLSHEVHSLCQTSKVYEMADSCKGPSIILPFEVCLTDSSAVDSNDEKLNEYMQHLKSLPQVIQKGPKHKEEPLKLLVDTIPSNPPQIELKSLPI